jgi:hypothetical protein
VFHLSCRRSVLPVPDRRIVGLLLLGAALLVLAAGVGLGAPSRADAKARLTACNDGIDNDGDTKIDNFDPGCLNGADDNEMDLASAPQCSDTKDNEAVPDGKVDFPADPGCSFAGNNNEKDPANKPQCADGIDNPPADGTADFAGVPSAVPPLPPDPNCIWAADNVETPRVCSDGIDNETPVGDGKIDWPADPGCGGPNDMSEIDPPQCNDGRDNDGDGKIDTDTNLAGQTADPGCSSAADDDETDPPPGLPSVVARCADGIDNDGDGKIDFPADRGCTSAADDDEADPAPGMPIIVLPPCADGKDNDLDGRIDFPTDPGCTSAADNDETDVALGGSSTGTRILSPFPVVRMRGRVFPSSVLITLLTVRAPKASRVTTYCTGKSCPRKRLAVVAGRQTVRVRRFERRLRAGTVLRIYVTKSGYIGKYTRFTVVKGRPPVRVDRCARKAGSAPRSCPTS